MFKSISAVTFVCLCWLQPLTLSAQTQIFDDVAASSPYLFGVNYMYNLQITSGCLASPLLYCPDYSLTRDQMAVFVIRAWSMKLWGDPEAFKIYSPPSVTPYLDDVID